MQRVGAWNPIVYTVSKKTVSTRSTLPRHYTEAKHNVALRLAIGKPP